MVGRMVLRRFRFTDKVTVGFLVVLEPSGSNDLFNKVFECMTLEDCDRCKGDPNSSSNDWKIAGQTAIPAGIYNVCKTWSNKFSKMCWEVMNVPQFKGIRIHAGNTDQDTEGCILLGQDCPFISGYDKITGSKLACGDFEQITAKYDRMVLEIQT